MKGTCEKKTDERFLHFQKPEVSKEQCPYWLNGHCYKGEECDLKHDEKYKEKFALKTAQAVEIAMRK